MHIYNSAQNLRFRSHKYVLIMFLHSTYGDPSGQRYYTDSEITLKTHYVANEGGELAVVGLPPLVEMPRKATHNPGDIWR